tara:strand:- start:203 stop:481 length:279 start_codon:yes stop_codon:yes gene_type:complete
MQEINKFEKEKIMHLLESCSSDIEELLIKSNTIFESGDNIYDFLLKVLQEGYNIREATLIGILIGKKIGYADAKTELEEEIKEKLYNAFKNQ